MKPVILVVDDDRLVRDFLVLALKPLYEVHQAPDGLAGWRKVQDLRPALVVMDLGMPGMDGLELTDRIKATPDLAETVILILTGATRGEDLPPAFWRKGTGADGFLEKPVDPATLRCEIDRLLKERVDFRPLPPGKGTYEGE